MKIIAGRCKGQNIQVPPNATIEPVKSEVCQAIFSILGNAVVNAACLDLFAGSGALGLEALSRGAASCHFVEGDREAVDSIKDNIKHLKVADQALVTSSNVRHFLKKPRQEGYQIIFLDPPYVTPISHILKQVVGLLLEQGIVVYLCGKDRLIPNILGLEVASERCYGQTKLVILTRS